MKRFATLVFVVLCVATYLFLLVSCDPNVVTLDTDELLANTVKIELVNYENENPKLIHNLDGRKKPTFDFNNVTAIATLDDSKFEEIINDLGSYHYPRFERTLNEPIGKTLILYQSNGDMLVFFASDYKNEKGETRYYDGCIMFDKDGRYIDYIYDFYYKRMDELISKYFSSTLEPDTSP